MFTDARSAFQVLRKDLNKKLKEDNTFKNYIVGDKGHSTHGKDHGIDDGLYKFKIYENGESYPSTNYQAISRDHTEICDYPNLKPADKENFLTQIINELKQK